MGKFVIIIGTQWGDEGKGKVVDWLTDHAQGAMLDVDQGTYPFVTSSYTTGGFAGTGTGIGPRSFDYGLGIV